MDSGLADLEGSWLLARGSAEADLVGGFLARWRRAVETHDAELIAELFSPAGFTFCSPVVHRAYTELGPVLLILQSVLQVLPDFRYSAVCFGRKEGSRPHLALCFEGTLTTADGRQRRVQGADFVTLGADGLITDFRVAIRPLGALQELSKLMKARIEAAMSRL